jgi:hypothetical protein
MQRIVKAGAQLQDWAYKQADTIEITDEEWDRIFGGWLKLYMDTYTKPGTKFITPSQYLHELIEFKIACIEAMEAKSHD